MASLSPDDEVPNDSPALRIISADTFDALLTEADRLGVLARWVGPRARPQEEEKGKPEIEVVDLSGEEVAPEIARAKQAGGEDYFNYKIQLTAIESIKQIVAIGSTERLGSLAKSK